MSEIPHKLKIEIHNIHSLIKEMIRKATVLHGRPTVITSESDQLLMEALDKMKVSLGVYEDFMDDFKESYVKVDSEIILEEVKKQKERENKERERK